MRLLFDAEADNLLEEATKVWCIVAKDIDKGELFSFAPHDMDQGLLFLSQAEVLIGHNIIGYDLPLFEKLHGMEYGGTIIDTLILSRLQYPDRPLPKNYNGRATHSVEAWGHRLGFHKPEHNDWTQFSPEMLHRCKEDVLGTELIYYALEEERKK